MVNVFGVVGLVLSVVGLILIAAGGALPHFVDVFLVRTADQTDDSNEVAGVGVFSSVYDATGLSAAAIAESGVPNEKFDTPTLEFPLLFPAQENFAADVLPITADQVIELDAALGADGAVSDPVVVLIEAIEGVEFDTCDAYFADQFTNLQALFNQLQTATIPLAFQAVSALTAATFDDAVVGTAGVLGTNENNVHKLLINTLITFGNSCGSTNADDTDNSIKGCYVTILTSFATAASAGGAVVLGSTLTEFASYLSSTDVDGFSIDEAVFGEISYIMDVNVVVSTASVTYLDNIDGLKDFCEFIPNVTLAGQCTVADYMQGSARLWGEAAAFVLSVSAQAGELAEGLTNATSAVAAYLGAVNTGLISNSNTIQVNAGASLSNAILATVDFLPLVNANDSYSGHCIFIQAAQAADPDAEFEVPSAGPCTFEEYLVGLPLFLESQENDLAPTVAQIAGLYFDCFGASGGNVGLCPLIFTYGLLDGAYSGDIEIDPTTDFVNLTEGVGQANFIARGVSECEDDVTDHDKVAQAQVMIIVGYVFYALASLIAIGALVASNPFLYGISGVFGLLAGVLVIGALLVVQSAPVYEAVGDEPVLEDGQTEDDLPLAPLYVNGAVVLMALIAAAAEILAGILFFVAAGVAAKSMKEFPKEEADVEEVEKKKPAKAVEPVAEPVAKAEEVEESEEKGDVVPGTNVSI